MDIHISIQLLVQFLSGFLFLMTVILMYMNYYLIIALTCIFLVIYEFMFVKVVHFQCAMLLG